MDLLLFVSLCCKILRFFLIKKCLIDNKIDNNGRFSFLKKLGSWVWSLFLYNSFWQIHFGIEKAKIQCQDLIEVYYEETRAENTEFMLPNAIND